MKQINKKPVVDAKRGLPFHISEHHCKVGARKNARCCAAALGLMEEPGVRNARVHLARTYVEYDDHWTRYATPESLRREVVAFDRGGQFQPGEYKLLKISENDTIEKRRERGATRNRSTKNPDGTPRTGHRKHHITVGVRQRFKDSSN